MVSICDKGFESVIKFRKERRMFKPNFGVTNKIISHIVDIAAARELILNASLLPRWEVKLRKEQLSKWLIILQV